MALGEIVPVGTDVTDQEIVHNASAPRISINGQQYPGPGKRVDVLKSTAQPVKLEDGRWIVASETSMEVAACLLKSA